MDLALIKGGGHMALSATLTWSPGFGPIVRCRQRLAMHGGGERAADRHGG